MVLLDVKNVLKPLNKLELMMLPVLNVQAKTYSKINVLTAQLLDTMLLMENVTNVQPTVKLVLMLRPVLNVKLSEVYNGMSKLLHIKMLDYVLIIVMQDILKSSKMVFQLV